MGDKTTSACCRFHLSGLCLRLWVVRLGNHQSSIPSTYSLIKWGVTSPCLDILWPLFTLNLAQECRESRIKYIDNIIHSRHNNTENGSQLHVTRESGRVSAKTLEIKQRQDYPNLGDSLGKFLQICSLETCGENNFKRQRSIIQTTSRRKPLPKIWMNRLRSDRGE